MKYVIDAPSINNRWRNGSLRFHRRNERAIVRMKMVKSKTRRPEKATATGFPDEREDEGALPLHGMYAYGKR